jgi:superfamily II DNA or RNA helicase
MIESAVAKGKSILFLAHARELIKQCSNKLDEFGVRHGIIMAGEETMPAQVMLASKDTLLSRAVRRNKIGLPHADLVFADEAHRSLSKFWKHLINHYSNAIIIGLTATPARGNGSGLGGLYQKMVQTIPYAQLIQEGYLVRTRVFAPYRPNLKGIKLSSGEYHKTQLEKRMNQAELVGDIVNWWKKLGEDRQTVVFASGVSHSRSLQEEFARAGIKCEHLDGGTDTTERDGILSRLSNGTTRIVTNCGVLLEGWDCPNAACVIDAQPTKSIIRFRQKAGRIQRPAPGKADALYLDHAGNVYRHGFPDADIEWELDPEKKVQEKYKKNLPGNPIVCPRCHAMYSGLSVCPNCGYKPHRRSRPVENKNGILAELHRDGDGKETMSPDTKQKQWHRALAISAHKGLTLALAAKMYRDFTGELPWNTPGLGPMPAREDWQNFTSEQYPQYVRAKK